MSWDGHITTPIRQDLRAEGGLAFFEWVFADPERTGTVDPLWRAVDTALGDGTWAENDVLAIIASLRRGGMKRNHTRRWAALVPAIDEWLLYRRRVGRPVFEITQWLNDHEGEDLANVEV